MQSVRSVALGWEGESRCVASARCSCAGMGCRVGLSSCGLSSRVGCDQVLIGLSLRLGPVRCGLSRSLGTFMSCRSGKSGPG